MIHQGQRFSDAYKLMLLKYPQYNYALKFPMQHLIKDIHEETQRKILARKIHQFAKTHGFFFFFASTCSYCHAFSPIVKQLIDKYGISVIAISMDGGIVPEFPKVVPDNAIAKALNITHIPALLAVQPHNKKIIPIATGFLSLSELEENILRILDFENEES